MAALQPVWSFDAMAAVPTPATLDAGLIDSLAGSVRFRAGRVGLANLICPIAATLQGQHLRSLRLTYRDPDAGSGLKEEDRPDRTRVSAVMRRVRMSDGHVENIPNSNVSSNDLGAPGGNGDREWHTHQSGSAGHTIESRLDFLTHYYYVQITLERSDPSKDIGVMGVYLIP